MITQHQIDTVKNHPDFIHCSATYNSMDNSYAGCIECICGFSACEIVKSGYIFSTDKEAIDWAQQFKKEVDKG